MGEHHSCRRKWCPFIGIIAILCSTSVSGQSLDLSCDNELQPIFGSQGYQLREVAPRCEGIFESPVRAIDLEVVSFLVGDLDFSLNRDRHLVVSVPAAASLVTEEVHIRAVGLPPRTYYRMDAVVTPGGQMLWPIHEVLAPQALGPDRLGLFGWFGDQTDRTLVAIIVRPEGASASAEAKAELKLRTPVDLERVRWRVRRENAATSDASWTSLSGQPIRAGDTFGVLLPPQPQGRLRVDFSAKRRNMDQWLTVSLHVVGPS